MPVVREVVRALAVLEYVDVIVPENVRKAYFPVIQRRYSGVDARHHALAEPSGELKFNGSLRPKAVRHVGLQGHHLFRIEAHAEVYPYRPARFGKYLEDVFPFVPVKIITNAGVQEYRAERRHGRFNVFRSDGVPLPYAVF